VKEWGKGTYAEKKLKDGGKKETREMKSEKIEAKATLHINNQDCSQDMYVQCFLVVVMFQR